jgi:hypothetical protein
LFFVGSVSEGEEAAVGASSGSEEKPST